MDEGGCAIYTQIRTLNQKTSKVEGQYCQATNSEGEDCMQPKILENKFRAWPMDELENVLTQQMASVDGSGQLFKPYIPLIGQRYDEYRILVYGTAQNMSKDAAGVAYKYYIENPEHLVDRLYWDSSFTKRYEDGNLRFGDVMISPYKQGVIPALIGLLIKAGELSGIDLRLDNYEHIMDASSVSNYYKFSLYAGGRDLNPELIYSKEDAGRVEIEKYHRFNDALVKEEICFLKPRYIMAFKGRKIDVLEKLRGDEVPPVPRIKLN